MIPCTHRPGGTLPGQTMESSTMKNRNAELGDVLDAVESASDQELKVLREISRKLSGSSNVTITRPHRNPPQQQPQSNQRQRDSRGRFIKGATATPERIGGSRVVRNPRQPRQGDGGSLWARGPSKSSQAQANAKADAQREAVEDQTKETISRQDKTNSLLEELLKLGKKDSRKSRRGSSDDGGVDVDINRKGGWRGGGKTKKNRRGQTKKNRKQTRGRGGVLGKALGLLGIGLAGKSAYDLASGDGGVMDVANTALAGTDVASAAAKTKTGQAIAGRVGAAAGKTGITKLAEKGGLKAVGKIGMRAIPVIGTALSVGFDAVNGWSDKAGHSEAFKLKNGQEASTRQKAEYSLANIADMGGLVSGGAGLLGAGAQMLGMDGVAKSLSFTTADMARGIDSVGNDIEAGWTGLKNFFSGDSKDSEKAAEDRNQKLITAVEALGLGDGSGKSKALSPAATAVVSSKMDTLAADITQATGTRTDGYRLGGKGAGLRNKRNNNFGNLAYDGWVKGFEGAQLEARPGGEKGVFASFATPDQGIRANATQLHRYGTGEFQNGAKGKLNTVSKVIGQWAPPNENNTAQYIKTVSKQLGVNPNDEINMDDPVVLEALMRSMASVEGGDISMSSEAFRASLGELKNGRWVAQESPEAIRKKIETSGPINTAKVTPINAAPDDSNSVATILQEQSKRISAAFNSSSGEEALQKLGIGNFGPMPAPVQLPKSSTASLQIATPGITHPSDFSAMTGTKPAAAPAAARSMPATFVDILRSSAADTFNWATQGISGSTMLDGALGGLNPFIADAIKPLTNMAGGQLDSILGAGRNTVTDFLNGRPKNMQSVTDLAASSAAVPVTRGDETSQADAALLEQVKMVVTRLEELMGITKEGQKSSSNPSEVVHSAQPAPNPNIPTEGWGTALAELLRGVL